MNIDLVWTPHPENPLIGPVWPEWLIGDPVVLGPEASPDGQWHMFLNTVFWVFRYISSDGIKWRRAERVCHGMRTFVFPENGEYHLFYEMNVTPWHSILMKRSSRNLHRWSLPKPVLFPTQKWETGGAMVMSCPCVVKADGRYRLYYSTGQVFLKDLGFPEPKYIGVAEADNIGGPYTKAPEPMFGPDPSHPMRNLGAGAIKVYRDEENGRWVGFNNGIYADEEGRSRSAIMLLTSDDGLSWTQPSPEPVVAPTDGWKRALVYQLCVVERPGGELWMYYNARDGWRQGTERIGLEIGRPRKK